MKLISLFSFNFNMVFMENIQHKIPCLNHFNQLSSQVNASLNITVLKQLDTLLVSKIVPMDCGCIFSATRLCRLGYSWAYILPVPESWGLGLHVCITQPSSTLHFYKFPLVTHLVKIDERDFAFLVHPFVNLHRNPGLLPCVQPLFRIISFIVNTKHLHLSRGTTAGMASQTEEENSFLQSIFGLIIPSLRRLGCDRCFIKNK